MITNVKKSKYRSVIKYAIVLIFITVFGSLFYINLNGYQVIPKTIMQHIAYQVYIPIKDSSLWKISKESIKYDGNQNLLSMTIMSTDNQVYITEQNTPAIFTDVPQYYPALLDKLNQYAAIQTNLGEVALTHLKELNGGQTAVYNLHGTLMFARPKNNLSNTEWQQLFNSLIVIK